MINEADGEVASVRAQSSKVPHPYHNTTILTTTVIPICENFRTYINFCSQLQYDRSRQDFKFRTRNMVKSITKKRLSKGKIQGQVVLSGLI